MTGKSGHWQRFHPVIRRVSINVPVSWPRSHVLNVFIVSVRKDSVVMLLETPKFLCLLVMNSHGPLRLPIVLLVYALTGLPDAQNSI